MISNKPVATVFHEGDEIVLAEGTYQGTPGIFDQLNKDTNWAEITERDGSVRSHPVVWMDHAAGAIRHSMN